MLQIGIIDYDSGNLQSVSKALAQEGATTRLIQSPDLFSEVDALVLPGVGSFGSCMESLEKRNLTRALQEWIKADRPFLGICLGYQLLFENSEESPGVPGLNIFKGSVRRFSQTPNIKIPHMGWNTLKRGPSPDASHLWKNLKDSSYVYFVHSFFPVPADQNIVAATCSYHVEFAAAITCKNLIATQFHPEKSQATGLAILQNFLSLVSLVKTTHS